MALYVEILAESTSQADFVKYSILLDADDHSKKLVSPWPTIVTRTCHCATRPIADFLIVATSLRFATRPRTIDINSAVRIAKGMIRQHTIHTGRSPHYSWMLDFITNLLLSRAVKKFMKIGHHLAKLLARV